MLFLIAVFFLAVFLSALSGTCILEVRNGGSDTANGALFNPGATFTGDLAATNANTSSPVVTSASYNFTNNDKWLFIKQGTNWIPGWYPIVSTSGGAATLDASVGAAFLYSTTAAGPYGPSAVAGCATVASPTSGSWGVDYSQQDSPQYSLTGLSTAAANAIILTASASVNMIGNGIVITGGTNFTTGYYQINSVSAGVSITVDRTCTTAAGSAGTAAIGGGLASPGGAGALLVSNMLVMTNYNATAFTATTASTNTAGGCVTFGSNTGIAFCGYDTNRYVFNDDANRPTFKVGASSATLFAGAGASNTIMNFILDGDNQTTSRGINSGNTQARNCLAKNFTSIGFSCRAEYCVATANSGIPFSGTNVFCEAYSNTATGFNGNSFFCLSYNNSGASTDGFAVGSPMIGCVAYNNGRDNFRNSTTTTALLYNCISESAAAFDFNQQASNSRMRLRNCASYSPTGSGRTNGSAIYDASAITGSGSFFVNAASGNFALNNTAGAGALCRAAGFPSTFPAGATANYLDVGAAQHQDSGGGGGGKILNSSIIEGLGAV